MKKRKSKPKLGTVPSKGFETTLPPGWRGAQMFGVRSVDFLNPREAAAAHRAKRAAGGVAGAVKRLRRQLAEQLGKAPEFGVRTMKVREASTPVLKADPRALRGWGADVADMLGKRKRAELLESVGLIGGLLCTVEGCGSEVGPGGRKSSPAKCARCYQRERRGQVEAPRRTELRGEKLTVNFTTRGRELLEKRAAGFGVSISVLLEGLLDGTYVAHRVKR